MQSTMHIAVWMPTCRQKCIQPVARLPVLNRLVEAVVPDLSFFVGVFTASIIIFLLNPVGPFSVPKQNPN
jgi:hypothetical protein